MVVSSPITGAAIIGGELILSLPTGQIINCGLVQGPPGPKGSIGAPGERGLAGADGCSLLHGDGYPDPGLGKSGDFYWMVSPEVGVFGPKTGSGWGSPVMISRPITANKADYKPIAGQSGGGGADGGSGPSKVYTNQVIATGSGRLAGNRNRTTVNYTGSPNGILSPSGPLDTQANINGWIVKALEELDAVVPVAIVDTLPAKGEYTGDLVLCEGSLHIWAETEWVAVSGQGGAVLSDIRPVGDFEEGALWFCTAEDDLTLYVYLGDGADQGWVPAAPPVSLDGVQSAIASIDEQLMKVNANVAMNKSELDEKALDIQLDQERQDGEIRSLEQEIEGIVPSFDRGVYGFTDKLQDLASSSGGHYAIVSRFVTPTEMCNTLLGKCQEAAGEDVSAKSQCNKDYTACLDAIDGEDGDAPLLSSDWNDAQYLWIDPWDKNNELHTFRDAKAGKYIELTNSDGSGNMVALIDEDRVEVDPGLSQIKIKVLSWKGKPLGDTRIKLFEISAADPSDYLKKTGDTMTGRLTINRPHDHSNFNSFRIFGRVGGKVDQILLKDYQRKLSTDGSTPKDDYIEYHGPCDNANSIANRDQIKALIQQYATPKPTPTPFTWTLEKHSSANPSEGCMAWEKGKFIVLNQTTFEGVKLKNPTNLPSGAHEFASYRVPAYNGVTAPSKAKNMQIWMEYAPDYWELMAWMTPYKYRFWYKGWVQLEYTNMEGSMPDEYGKRFGVTLPELF